MANAVYIMLPKPIAISQGASMTLSAILTYEFGAVPTQIASAWLYDDSAATLAKTPFSYWDPSNPAINYWSVSGTPITPDTSVGPYSSSQFSNITYTQGNEILYDMTAYLGTWYYVNAVAPALMSAKAGVSAPTAQDIVDEAYKFANYYGSPANTEDCHQIASEVAAAAGAVLPHSSFSLDPTQNEEQGFWRIAYRGSDPGAVSNWQTKVLPGDIVRIGWTSGGPHTFTVLSVNYAADTMTVYDNADYINGVESIGVHTTTYDTKTITGDVTIYRLTTDGIYLMNGSSGNDTLIASSYNSKFTGGAGNDTLVGGSGQNTATYSGTFASYKIVRNIDGSDAIADQRTNSPDGTDSLTNIQVATFSDRTYRLIGANVLGNDFNGNISADILFRNTSGTSYLWSMSGTTVSAGATTSVQVGNNWQIQGIGDFNGDGRADILWVYNNASNSGDALNGVSYLSTQNGAAATSSSGVVQQLSSVWQVAGVDDFTGDGKSDVLYRNASTGQTYMDIMNGASINWSASGFTSQQVTNANWQIVDTGDFNGDGNADVLWRYNNASNTSDSLNGTLYEWQMNGTTVQSAGLLSQQASANWTVAGTGDFDGDGHSDILFRYENASNASDPLNGVTYIDFMNGSTVKSGAATQWQSDNSWIVASIGDYNGDGKADILWQQTTTGNTYIWSMNGANVIAGNATSQQAGNGWTVQNGVHIG